MNKLLVPIDEIKLWDQNPREITDKDFQSLKKKIQRWGLWKPFLVWESRKQILGGNQRYKAVKDLGYTEVWIEYREPKNEAEALEMAIADNESAGEWIKSLLVEQIKMYQEEINLDDYKIVIKSSGLRELVPINKEEDELPDEDKIQSVIKEGDLIELGKHRILCGDSTLPENLSKLMNGVKSQMVFTDPPYNVNYTGGIGTHGKNVERQAIENDNMSKEAFKQFLKNSLRQIIQNTEGGIYICMSSSELASLKDMFEEEGGHWQSFIIWVKNNFTLSRADYQNTYEPILYGWPTGVVNHYFTDERDIANVWEDLSQAKSVYDGTHTTISFAGFKVKLEGKIGKGEIIRKKQHMDIWRYDKPVRSDLHPTQKPIALVTEAILNSSHMEQVVLDTFLGSGTTLIAAEKCRRICYGMELDTHYVDTIIGRYIKYMADNNKEFTLKINGQEINSEIFIKDGL